MSDIEKTTSLDLLSPEKERALTQIDGALGAVDEIANQLTGAISGDFDFSVSVDTDNPTIQKLSIMVNFLLESVRDAIGQRNRMADTLRGASFLRQLLDLSPEVIFTRDLEGRFTLANRAAAALYNTTVEAMIGKREAELGIAYEGQSDINLIERQVITTGQPAEVREESFTPPGGELRWFQSVRVPVRDADGIVRQSLTVSTDITAYKGAVEEQKRLVVELQASMKFKDQILATMSHELRTPLNAIMGFSGIGLMEDDLSDNVEMMFERIDYNARRLLTLINAILDISRLNAGRVDILWQPVDVRVLAESWKNDFAGRIAEKSLELVYEIDADFPAKLESDPDRLTQIAVNLLANAVKFTEKGKITLAIRSTPTHWSIEVTDTGIGISETWQEQIFEEFRQVTSGATSKYGGSGLGLSIVQKLCNLMNGNIRVKSEIGVGSSFTATFALRPVKLPDASVSNKDLA